MSSYAKGIIAAMVTPMNTDESLNLRELRNQVHRHLEAGVDGVFCLGTSGEAYILDENEKEQVIGTVVEEVNGRVPVYAGTGCIGTAQTIRLSKKAKSLGADVLSVITPYFAAASQSDVCCHYTDLAEAVDMPIVLYNMPARTNINLTPDTIRSLAEIPNIIGVKDSSGNFDNMLQYIEKTRGMDFNVLSGNDSLILWNLLAGGSGGITAIANLYPKKMVSIYRNFVAGDLEAARKAQDSIRPIRNCFKFGNPNTITKTAVNLLGYPVGPLRKPFDGLSDAAMDVIRQTLAADQRNGME